MPEHAWIYDNKQGSEYFSYNTMRGETPQVFMSIYGKMGVSRTRLKI